MKKKKLAAFTLLEMLVVILIISALILLFAPKLMEQREIALETSDRALVRIVHEQFLIQNMDSSTSIVVGRRLSGAELDGLINAQMITPTQRKRYEQIPDERIE